MTKLPPADANGPDEPPYPASVELTPGWRLWSSTALRSAGMPYRWLAPFALESEEEDSAEAGKSWSAEAVRQILRHDPFLAALTWQNPSMVEQWVGDYAQAVATGGASRLHHRGYREAKLAKYAQRYCAKNETIGFFGPVAWGRLDEQEAGISIAGSWDIANLSVFFEVWAIQCLAGNWRRDERLLPYLPVRLHPTCSVTGNLLRRPRHPPEELAPLPAGILGAIDGQRQFSEVVAAAAATAGPGEDVAGELLRLRDRKVVLIGFTVPIDEHPERSLAAQVALIPEPGLRDDLAAELDVLESVRQQIVQVARVPGQLAGALGKMRSTFESLAGTLPDREHRYGRVPVYLDCRRDLVVTLGASALDRLRQPLGLLLESARWFVDQVAEEVLAELHRRFRLLHARSSDGRVSLESLQLAASDMLAGAPGTLIHDIAADFRLRWAEIIPASGAGKVRLAASQIAALVSALFPPGTAGWASSRYHSPDLMLGYLDGRDAEPVWVLGELHMALNTLENRMFHTQAIDRAALLAAAGQDLASGRILPLYATTSPEVTSRTYPPSAVHLDTFAYWSYAADDGHPQAGTAALPAAGLMVTEEGGQLMVHPPGQRWRATALEFFGDFLTAMTVNHFQIHHQLRHAPRVRVDDLVICRESWRVTAAELAVPAEAAARADYNCVALKRCLQELSVPRHAFYRVAGERKPAHVDLAAPLHMRNLASAIRQALRNASPQALVEITEMLPGPEELWLADASGERYTSEFRVVAVDTRHSTPVFQDSTPASQFSSGKSG